MTDEPTNPSAPTWYDVLGVDRDATPEQIKAAWRVALDDVEPGTPRFRALNQAADALLDPEQRRAYDDTLAPAAPASVPSVEEHDQDESEPTSEPAPTRPPGRLARTNKWIVLTVAVVAAAATAVAVVLGVGIQRQIGVERSHGLATAAATRALQTVLSYDYRQLEQDKASALKYLTPKYGKEYAKNFDGLITEGPEGSAGPAVKTQTVVTAQVLNTGVVAAEPGRVEVLAFVDQTSVKGDRAPAIFQNRVVVTMVERDGGWLLDDIRSY